MYGRGGEANAKMAQGRLLLAVSCFRSRRGLYRGYAECYGFSQIHYRQGQGRWLRHVRSDGRASWNGRVDK
jgi:hypothetical protein